MSGGTKSASYEAVRQTPEESPLASCDVWRGETLAARLIRTLILPLMRVKRQLRDPKTYARVIAESRKTGEAKVPSRMLDRYTCTAFDVGGRQVLSVEPRGGAWSRTVIYIHGGAYVSPMIALQWNLVNALLNAGGVRVIVPRYPLAPEHDWKPAFGMLRALYAWVASSSAPHSITLAGDSAGGGFALALAQVLRDEGPSLPGRLLLFSPWLDLEQGRVGQDAYDRRDPILARPGLVWAADRWAGETDRSDPHVSPIFGSLKGLPPMLVFSGTADLLHTDALALLDKARAEDVRLKLIIGENMTHAWSILATADARCLNAMSAAFIHDRLQ